MPTKAYRRSGRSASSKVNNLINYYNTLANQSAKSVRQQNLVAIVDQLGNTSAKKKEKRLTITNQVVDNLTLLNQFEADKSAVPHTAWIPAKEPKTGFEIEWPDVYLIDTTKLKEHTVFKFSVNKTKTIVGTNLLNELNKFQHITTNDGATKNQLKEARYSKRSVLFSAPNGSWKGTADSTLEAASNLEIVTEPLSNQEWDDARYTAGGEDHEALKQFIKKLSEAPHGVLLSPNELCPELLVHDANVALLKHSTNAVYHIQMTRAEQLATNSDPCPDWWIAGLNWNAYPLLKHLMQTLSKKKGLFENNPKNEFGDFILKSPICKALGTPKTTPTPDEMRAWVKGVCKDCNVSLDEEVARTIVDSSKGNNKLNPTGFTWKDFLMALIDGKDLIQTWAKNAFICGNEDVGYGQINDPDLPEGWVIKEYRQLNASDFGTKGGSRFIKAEQFIYNDFMLYKADYSDHPWKWHK